jgi:hypothetical protein
MKVGDKVSAVPDLLAFPIDKMLEGKVGTIVQENDGYWDFVVHFPNTTRIAGLFGFDKDQLKLEES